MQDSGQAWLAYTYVIILLFYAAWVGEHPRRIRIRQMLYIIEMHLALLRPMILDSHL